MKLLSRRTITFIFAFLTSSEVTAQDIAMPNPDKLWISKDKSDLFIGYFVPPNQKTNENFQTCGGISKKVDPSSVDPFKFTAICEHGRNMFSALSEEKFYNLSIGGYVFSTAGAQLGAIKAITVDGKGGISAYLLDDALGSGTFVVEAGSMSAWSPGDGRKLTFLADSSPKAISLVSDFQVKWLTPKVESELKRVLNQSGMHFDLKDVVVGKEPIPFSSIFGVGVLPAH